MRFGVLADIHGNLPALEAVLEALGPVDGLLCAGDIVGYNPWPGECVERVRELDAVTVRGNHDRAVAFDGGERFNWMASAGVDYAREVLDDDAIAWLRSLPTEAFVANGRVHIVHGHPDDPDRYTYPREFSASMLGEGIEVLICGHTHVQGTRRFDDGIVFNPGSVGQPRDGDPTAAFAVLDLDGEPSVDQRRVEYDIDRVIEAVEEAGLPTKIGTRLVSGN
ncbi:MAG: metallophosphoesterase family protein [Halohasta sp.]